MDGLVYLLQAMVIIGIVFLLLREVVCWYWKMNQTTKLLTEIRDELRYWRDKGKAKKAIDVKAELSAKGSGPQAGKK